MSSKQRVYEVAKQIQVDQKELVALVQSWGLTEVKNHMSTVEPDVVDRIKRHYERLRQPAPAEERNARSNALIRRRPAAPPAPPAPPAATAPVAPVAQPSAPVAVPPIKAARPSSTVASVPAVPAPPPSRSSGRFTEPKIEARAAVPPSRGSTRVELPEPPRPSVVAEPPAAPEPAAPVAETKAEPKAEPKVEAKTEAKVEPKAEPKVEAKAEPKAEPKAEAKAEPEKGKSSPPAAAEVKAAEPKVEKTESTTATAPAASPKAPAADAADEPAPATTASPALPSTQPSTPPAVIPPMPPVPAPVAPVAAAPAPAPVAAEPPRTVPPRPSTTPAAAPAAAATASTPPPAPRVPKTGIEVWDKWQKAQPAAAAGARPGGQHQRRQQIDINKSSGPQRPSTGPISQRPGGPPMSGRPQTGRPPGSYGGGGYGNRPGNNRYNSPPKGPASKIINTAERKEKIIKIEGRVNLQTLAGKMSLKATEVLQKLIQLGMQGVHINSSLDIDIAKILASEFGWEVEDVSTSEEEQLTEARGEEAHDEGAEPRPPIVTVMGHVDHGKTSLLDQIRKTKVAEGEAGGITQHIGAYRVNTNRGVVTFLDTPGHEAFTAMRARGANLTDIVILVVAADDGVMPQTREAVIHAKAAKVPIIVAVNKIDKPEANPDRVKRQLMEYQLVPEEFGGDVIYTHVSAKQRIGIDELLDNVSLVAENALELRANPKRAARAIVVESLLDKGKGPVARVIVRDGTLKVGDFVLSGSSIGKIRAMTDDMGRPVKTAGPSTPVEILGLSDVPNAGDTLDAVSDPKKAQEIVEQRKAKERERQPQRLTFDNFLDRKSADHLELRVLIKADVQGSVEAIKAALLKLSSPKVSLSVVDASVGAITESDVNLAIAAKKASASGASETVSKRALIVGFNVRPAGKAAQLAESEQVSVKSYSIIYQLIDDVRAAMEGLLAPVYIEKALGKADVRVAFKLSKAGAIAGCMVIEGTIKRGAKARVRRDGAVIIDTKVNGLKRFKEDVREVAEGFECGIGVEDYTDIKVGDQIEVFELEQIRQTL